MPIPSLKICLLALTIGAAAPVAAQSSATPTAAPVVRDGSHDFDWQFGNWKTTVRRLKHALAGSNDWVTYTGTIKVTKVWDGKAHLLELDLMGPNGPLQALSLRLYNPDSHQWSTNFASAGGGVISIPSVGEFRNGVGQLYDMEDYNGRKVLVRLVLSQITPVHSHAEQFFSVDGGRTWELNWVNDDTRIGPPPKDFVAPGY
jgi:hypothetical protein